MSKKIISINKLFKLKKKLIKRHSVKKWLLEKYIIFPNIHLKREIMTKSWDNSFYN